MIFGIISFMLSAIILAYIARKHAKRKDWHRMSKAGATAASVRISFFLCLCAVPFLGFISMVLQSVKWAYYAESAVVVEGGAALLIGLMALLQRYGALFFRMKPAMELDEILVLIFLPAALFISHLFNSFIVLYYVGPAIYSAYLLYRETSGRLPAAA
jgi:hypothetical protein